MFRCTNISPGGRFSNWFEGTRLSEQPIHRYSGLCCLDNREKNSGSFSLIELAHAKLLSKRYFSDFKAQTILIHSFLVLIGTGSASKCTCFQVFTEEKTLQGEIQRNPYGNRQQQGADLLLLVDQIVVT